MIFPNQMVSMSECHIDHIVPCFRTNLYHPLSSHVQMHITTSNPNRMQGAMTNPATAAAANSTRMVMLDQRFFAKIHSLRRWVEQESQTVVLLFGVA